MEEAGEELQKILAHDSMRDISILVLSNKCDLPGAASTAQVAAAMGLDKERRRPWYVQGTIATKGEGVYEGLDWLCKSLKDQHKKAKAAAK